MTYKSPDPSPEEDEKIINPINMIPLIDIMLVLLVIFMIAMPTLAGSVKLQSSGVTIENNVKTVRIYVSREGQVFMEGKLLDFQKQGSVSFFPPGCRVILSADDDLTYGVLSSVLQILSQAGAGEIAFAGGDLSS